MFQFLLIPVFKFEAKGAHLFARSNFSANVRVFFSAVVSQLLVPLHAMKAYWGSGGVSVAPSILNRGTRWSGRLY